MKKILLTVGAGGMLAVTALFGLALVALLAIPLAASADEHENDAPNRPPSSVADCEVRSQGDHPRAQMFLDELVADEVISQEQAAEIELRLGEKHFDGCFARLLYERGNAIHATADVTASEPREVLGALVAGQSFSQYANEHGVDDATLIAAIMAAPEVKAAELVAAGEIDQATVDGVLANIESRVTDMIQKTDIAPKRRALRSNIAG
jgi:hypothetical protein